MVITSAEKQKNNEMIRIFINNTYAFSMPEEEFLRMHLYERKELSEDEICNIREEINVRLAKQRSIRLLTFRDRSECELKENLKKQGFDNDVADEAVLQLKAMGYVNDRLYAHKFISDRLKLKPKSKKALFYELQKKGIDTNLINEVLEDFELDESLFAFRIAKKKYGKYNANDPQIQRKIVSYLFHRGFTYDIISDVLKQMAEQ